MKSIIILTILVYALLAEYETGKIDMHGGEDYSYQKRNSFNGVVGMRLSNFLDKNSSKEVKPKSVNNNYSTFQ